MQKFIYQRFNTKIYSCNNLKPFLFILLKQSIKSVKKSIKQYYTNNETKISIINDKKLFFFKILT